MGGGGVREQVGTVYRENFSLGFNFRLVRNLPEIANKKHSEKYTLLYVFIQSP